MNKQSSGGPTAEAGPFVVMSKRTLDAYIENHQTHAKVLMGVIETALEALYKVAKNNPGTAAQWVAAAAAFRAEAILTAEVARYEAHVERLKEGSPANQAAPHTRA